MANGWHNYFHSSDSGAGPNVVNCALAYDSARQRIILFGGLEWNPGSFDWDIPFTETWQWQNHTWTQLFPSVTPSDRSWQVLAYDPVVDAILMYGGLASTFAGRTDTLKFDCATNEWSVLSPASRPTSEYDTGYAYHAPSGGILCFGGVDQPSNTRNNQLWLFDWSNWSNITPGGSNPSARVPAAWCIAQDGSFFVQGGLTAVGSNGQTWKYTTSWTQLSPGSVPTSTPSQGVGMGRDYNGKVVHYNFDNLADFTWEWDESNWGSIQSTLASCGTGVSGTGQVGQPQFVWDPSHNENIMHAAGETWAFGSVNPGDCTPTPPPPPPETPAGVYLSATIL